MELTKEHFAILKHTQKNGLFCGDSQEIRDLCSLKMMECVGKKSFVPEPYFSLTRDGKSAIDDLQDVSGCSVIPDDLLAKKHTGMMISCSGLLGRIADGSKIRSDQRYILGEMYIHLKKMADRFYSGDVKAVDEFLQLYCLDKNRPAK